jgi:hypothetical protein
MEIYVHQHNIERIVNDKEFNEHLTNVLNEKLGYSPDGQGNFTTTAYDQTLFYEIDNKRYILNWLKNVVENYCKEKQIIIQDILIERSWCNRFFYGAKGKPHCHSHPNTIVDNVVILYYQIPENSSKFVLINSKEQLESYDEYKYKDLHFLPVRPGMAIIHDADVLHAVSEHHSDEPRTVFVFDIKIIGEHEHSVA